MVRIGSLFAGIGGFELGLEQAIPNSETVWQVEQNLFCQKVLKKNWPNAQIFPDVRRVGARNLSKVEIICGGFPCQDISKAGKREGLNGKKSGLWFEMRRVIQELRPPIVIIENVATLRKNGLGQVLNDLAICRYDAEWIDLRASDFGAPHERRRIFIIAYDKSRLFPQRAIADTLGSREQRHPSRTQRMEKKIQPEYNSCKNDGIQPDKYWEMFPTQPPLCRRDDGIPNRLDRIRALGNAIVPQCSRWVGTKLVESGLLDNFISE